MSQNSVSPDFVAPVDKQLTAYNAHHIDTLVSAYAEDVEIYSFPDRLLCTGRKSLRKIYEQLFSASPAIHAELIGRQVLEPYVIDHERITGLESPEGITTKESLVIYRIESGVIRAVWFLP